MAKQTQTVVIKADRRHSLLGIATAFETFLQSVQDERHGPRANAASEDYEIHRLRGYCEQLRIIADEQKG